VSVVLKESDSRPFAAWGSMEWANEQLKFAIRVLKGSCGGSRWDGNLQLALMIKDRLLEYGFVWQAERIENWIHRLQPRKADSLLESERERGIHTNVMYDGELVCLWA
jgi:hypothetical protein